MLCHAYSVGILTRHRQGAPDTAAAQTFSFRTVAPEVTLPKFDRDARVVRSDRRPPRTVTRFGLALPAGNVTILARVA